MQLPQMQTPLTPQTPADAGQATAYDERKRCVTQIKLLMEQPHTELPQAELWLSLAAIAEAEKGLANAKPEIDGYLSSAQVLLSSPELPHDATYAAACRRFAPIFEKYGRTAFAKQLLQTAASL